MTASEMLVRLLDFKNSSLEGATAKQIAAMKSDLDRLLRHAPHGEPGALTGGFWFGSDLGDITDGELAVLHGHVARLIDAVAKRVPMRAEDAPELPIQIVPSVTGKTVILSARGRFHDRVVLATLLLLREVGVTRIRACPVCGRSFVKVGRRKLCGLQECEQAVASAYWSHYKETRGGKRALKRAVKRRYDANNWTLGARAKKGGRK